MDYRFVQVGSEDYKQGLLVREALFFKGFKNAQELLNDDYEQKSIHLVALSNEKVIGTGRLTIIKKTAIISQMTVLPNFQRQQIGKQILLLLMEKSKSVNCNSIELSARITALEFYKKYGFLPVGEIYPSKKTGVLHQKMVLKF